ncbi:unnamed protein product [Closterium sp. NIES-65]|nr:unnamed protein product [Closterium sp. NIES-65]
MNGGLESRDRGTRAAGLAAAPTPPVLREASEIAVAAIAAAKAVQRRTLECAIDAVDALTAWCGGASGGGISGGGAAGGSGAGTMGGALMRRGRGAGGGGASGLWGGGDPLKGSRKILRSLAFSSPSLSPDPPISPSFPFPPSPSSPRLSLVLVPLPVPHFTCLYRIPPVPPPPPWRHQNTSHMRDFKKDDVAPFVTRILKNQLQSTSISHLLSACPPNALLSSPPLSPSTPPLRFRPPLSPFPLSPFSPLPLLSSPHPPPRVPASASLASSEAQLAQQVRAQAGAVSELAERAQQQVQLLGALLKRTEALEGALGRLADGREREVVAREIGALGGGGGGGGGGAGGGGGGGGGGGVGEGGGGGGGAGEGERRQLVVEAGEIAAQAGKMGRQAGRQACRAWGASMTPPYCSVISLLHNRPPLRTHLPPLSVLLFTHLYHFHPLPPLPLPLSIHLTPFPPNFPYLLPSPPVGPPRTPQLRLQRAIIDGLKARVQQLQQDVAAARAAPVTTAATAQLPLISPLSPFPFAHLLQEEVASARATGTTTAMHNPLFPPIPPLSPPLFCSPQLRLQRAIIDGLKARVQQLQQEVAAAHASHASTASTATVSTASRTTSAATEGRAAGTRGEQQQQQQQKQQEGEEHGKGEAEGQGEGEGKEQEQEGRGEEESQRQQQEEGGQGHQEGGQGQQEQDGGAGGEEQRGVKEEGGMVREARGEDLELIGRDEEYTPFREYSTPSGYKFVRFSAHRISPTAFAAVGVAPLSARHLSQPLSHCVWLPPDGSPLAPVRGAVSTVFPSHPPEAPMETVVLRCSFAPPAAPGEGEKQRGEGEGALPLGGRVAAVMAGGMTVPLIREQHLFDKSPPTTTTTFPPPFPSHLTLCLPPLHGPSISPRALLEFLSYHRLIGITSFLLYNAGGATDPVRAVIHAQAEQGRVETGQGTAQAGQGRAELVEMAGLLEREQLWNHGQVPALHDCLYRSRMAARWVLYLDLDDYLWLPPVTEPRPLPPLHILLETYDAGNSIEVLGLPDPSAPGMAAGGDTATAGGVDAGGGRLWRGGVVRDKKVPKESQWGGEREGEMQVERFVFHWPEPACHDNEKDGERIFDPSLCPGEQGHRKFIVDPRRVDSMGVFGPIPSHPTYPRMAHLSTSDLQLLHYRELGSGTQQGVDSMGVFGPIPSHPTYSRMAHVSTSDLQLLHYRELGSGTAQGVCDEPTPRWRTVGWWHTDASYARSIAALRQRAQCNFTSGGVSWA